MFKKFLVTKICLVLFFMMFLANAPQCYAEIWKFALISDTHDSDKLHTPTGVTPALSPIIDFIISQKPDFVIETGDLITGTLTKKSSPVYKKYEEQYKNYLENVSVLATHDIPLYVVRGNHDYGDENCDFDCLNAYMTLIASKMPQTGPDKEKGLTYSFTHKGIKFILADQYVDAANKMPTLNVDWIKKELLGGKDNKYIFVFGHSPMYAPTDEEKEHWNMFQQVSLRDELWKAFVGAGNVVAYISGHKHLYCRGIIDGVRQITIGDLGTLDAFNPSKVDSKIEQVFPQKAVTIKENRPGCMIITVDDKANTIITADYWLYGDKLQLHDEYRLK